MSASNEKLDAPARVTRSMRRLNSESDTVDLENRPETPTNRIRKKVEDNDAVLTPKRTTRASSATRSLLEEPVIASPLRRTTRRMSSDRAVESPIRATRSMRRSNQNLNESEDESVVFVSEQPATPRTLKSSRRTLVKLEEVVEEETDTNLKLNTSETSNVDKLNTSDNSNDLELRNRSISKSPCVQVSPNKNGKNAMSLSDELKAAVQVNGNKHEVFDFNNEDMNQSKDSITDEMNKEPEKLPESVEPESLIQNTEDDEPTPTQQPQRQSDEIDMNKSGDQMDESGDQEMIENEKDDEEINESTQKETEEISQNKSQDHVVPIEMETTNSNSMLEPMEINDTIKDMIETTQAGDLTDTSLRVEVRMTEKHEVIEYQVNDMMSDFVGDTSNAEIQNVSTTVRNVDIEIESSSHPCEVASESPRKTPQKLQDKSPLKSPQKSPRKSNTWSTAVTGSSQRIDAFTAPQVEEPIKAPTPKKSKVISSDEEEEEGEGNDDNSLIDDEAMEVGSDEESMTKSERDYMEQNEIVEDGESLGSEDSNANEIQSDSEHDSNDSFIVDDEVEEQYDMNSSEEEIEEIDRPKRKSRIIQHSSSEDEAEIESQNDEPEKEESISPNKSATPQKSPAKEKSATPQQSPVKEKSATPQQSPEKSASSPEKSPQKSAKKSAVETLIDSAKRISTRHSLPVQTATGSSKKSRKSIPPSWTVEDNDENDGNEQESQEIPILNERKRKRESVVHGADAKRFKEMSPNESEAIHMENVEDMSETPEPAPSTKKSKKSKEIPETDIAKVLDRCEEHLKKYSAEKKAKLALKRKKIEEKKLKKAQKDETSAVEGSPGSDNKENALEKKKKKKQKAKKQPLVAEVETEKEDMATKLTKRQEKLEQKREKKRKKKEMLKATKENSGGESMEVDDQSPVVVKKKKSQKNAEQPVEKKKVLGETKQKKQAEVVPEKKSKKQHNEPPTESMPENKSKKRRLDESNDDEIIERPKAKKKLNILQQVDDYQKPRSHDSHKPVKQPEFVLPTVTKKLKTVIPKGLDKEQPKKTIKKKGHGKVIPEPRLSLPRPVWTSSGMFIEESIEPYKFKSTEYKPINASSASTQFRVIPFEAKSKKAAIKDPRVELLLQRNKKGRDKTMRNMKNLM